MPFFELDKLFNMIKVNLLSRAEMKKVMGGVEAAAGRCSCTISLRNGMTWDPTMPSDTHDSAALCSSDCKAKCDVAVNCTGWSASQTNTPIPS